MAQTQRGPGADELRGQKQRTEGTDAAGSTVPQTSSKVQIPHPDDIPEPIRCEYVGMYCMALGVLEREAAGRARLCCRHYLDDEVA